MSSTNFVAVRSPEFEQYFDGLPVNHQEGLTKLLDQLPLPFSEDQIHYLYECFVQPVVDNPFYSVYNMIFSTCLGQDMEVLGPQMEGFFNRSERPFSEAPLADHPQIDWEELEPHHIKAFQALPDEHFEALCDNMAEIYEDSWKKIRDFFTTQEVEKKCQKCTKYNFTLNPETNNLVSQLLFCGICNAANYCSPECHNAELSGHRVQWRNSGT